MCLEWLRREPVLISCRQAPLLPRILNLQRSQLCYIVGTVYLDMPLKPNVLEDMARHVRLYANLTLCNPHSRSNGLRYLRQERNSTRHKTPYTSRRVRSVRLVGERIRRERDRHGGGLVTGQPSPAAFTLARHG